DPQKGYEGSEISLLCRSPSYLVVGAKARDMRTNFSWLLGSATIACAAVGSVVATLWLLGLNPNGTESTVLQAGPDSRPAVFRAKALPRLRQAVPKRKPTVAHRTRTAALPVRVQPAFVRRVVAPAHA